MNRVILMGRIVRDPEIRYSQGEKSTAVARFSLAVDRKFKQEGQPTADFISCLAFGKRAEFLEKYCIIKGGKEDITESQKKEIIGLRMHSTGFEGLIELKKAVGFSSKVIIEKASLDEIMIYMNKEAM